MTNQGIYQEIYNILMNNGQYFRTAFGNMFDSDDDIHCEIEKISNDVKKCLPITYSKQPSEEFNKNLLILFKQYNKSTS